MSQLAVTVIGPDRPGIIADVTEALAGTGVNLEDSTMTLLRGHFAMVIVCSGPYDEVKSAVGAPYMLSVHGADRPGIVAAVTRMIASAGGTITDLATRLSGELYVLTAEVELPPSAELEMLYRALEITAEELGVGVTLRPAESDDL